MPEKGDTMPLGVVDECVRCSYCGERYATTTYKGRPHCNGCVAYLEQEDTPRCSDCGELIDPDQSRGDGYCPSHSTWHSLDEGINPNSDN